MNWRQSTLTGLSANRPHAILRPVSMLFILASLGTAFVLNLLPWGQMRMVPDWVALGLVFWNIQHPRKVGIGIAFAMGLAMDVHDAALFGEHALAYTLVSYGAITLHRRVLWFPVLGQMAHVLPLLLVGQIASMIVRLAVGAPFPGLLMFAQSVTATLLWPVVTWLLLAPQRRPTDRDENRPL